MTQLILESSAADIYLMISYAKKRKERGREKERKKKKGRERQIMETIASLMADIS